MIKNSLLIFFTLFTFHPLRALIPHAVESLYIQAVVQFQDRKYVETLKTLDEAMEIEPGQKDILELKALTLKATRDWKQSEAAYKQLIELEKKDSQAVLPYYFEIATLKVQQKKFTEAKKIFQICISKKFNSEASRLYLGEIALKEKQYLEAQNYYIPLTESAGPLRPSAYLYLSLLFGELRSGQAQHENLFAANEAFALQVQEEKLQIDESYKAVKKTLNSLENNYFASVGFFSGYDTNVLLYPNLTSSEGATSQASFKSIVQAGFGYASKPSASLSFLGNYQGNFNYNFNSDTKSGQFFNNLLNLYLYSNQLAKNHWGARLDATYIFRIDESSSGLTNYALISTLAPFYETLLSPVTRNILSLELLYQNYFLDDHLDTSLQKTGFSAYVKEKWQRNRALGSWNPGFQVSLGYDYTRGTEFRQESLAVDFSNFFYIAEKHRLVSLVGTGCSLFLERTSGLRTDFLGKIGLTYYWDLSRSLSLNASGEARYNYSNVPDSFLYSRISAQAGLTYQI